MVSAPKTISGAATHLPAWNRDHGSTGQAGWWRPKKR